MRNQLKRLLTTIRVGYWPRLAGPLIGACALVALLATNVAADTTPATYYACANMKNGSIYMVNVGDTCQKGYTPMSWNQVGPQGPAGPTGPQGSQGPTQTLSVQMVVGYLQHSPILGVGDVQSYVLCPAGTVASGGGFIVFPIDDQATWLVVQSTEYTSGSLTGWQVILDNTNPNSNFGFEVYASCLTLS